MCPEDSVPFVGVRPRLPSEGEELLLWKVDSPRPLPCSREFEDEGRSRAGEGEGEEEGGRSREGVGVEKVLPV